MKIYYSLQWRIVMLRFSLGKHDIFLSDKYIHTCTYMYSLIIKCTQWFLLSATLTECNSFCFLQSILQTKIFWFIIFRMTFCGFCSQFWKFSKKSGMLNYPIKETFNCFFHKLYFSLTLDFLNVIKVNWLVSQKKDFQINE